MGIPQWGLNTTSTSGNSQRYCCAQWISNGWITSAPNFAEPWNSIIPLCDGMRRLLNFPKVGRKFWLRSMSVMTPIKTENAAPRNLGIKYYLIHPRLRPASCQVQWWLPHGSVENTGTLKGSHFKSCKFNENRQLAAGVTKSSSTAALLYGCKVGI